MKDEPVASDLSWLVLQRRLSQAAQGISDTHERLYPVPALREEFIPERDVPTDTDGGPRHE